VTRHVGPDTATADRRLSLRFSIMMRTRRARRHKIVEPQLSVLVEVHGELLQARSLHLSQSGEDFTAIFTYAPQYLARMRRGEAFPLDPINLPLRETPFKTQSRYTCLGALFDAALDAWGRTVMAQDEGIAATALAEETVLLKGRGGAIDLHTFEAVSCRCRQAVISLAFFS